jgi:competence protein ComEA
MSRSLMNTARLFVGGVLVALLLALAAVIWVDRATPVTVVVNSLPERPMQVSIEGAVATPGVVAVAPGARLNDVAAAAGGFTDEADFTNLNLAGRVGDGESVFIPALDDHVARSPDSSVIRSNDGGLVNINTAGVQDLDTLPGIGEVLANRIVDYREVNGPYPTVDDLARVDGISARMVETLRPLVTVGDGG